MSQQEPQQEQQENIQAEVQNQPPQENIIEAKNDQVQQEENAKENAKENVIENVQEEVKEEAKANIKEDVKENSKENIQEKLQEKAKEPVKEKGKQKVDLIKNKEELVKEAMYGKKQPSKAKVNTQETVQRLLEYKQKLQEKKEVLKQKQDKIIEQQTTFQPNKKEEAKLSFEEFLNNQKRHSDQKCQKVKDMIEQKQEEEKKEVVVQKPQYVCKGSAKINQKKNDSTVCHERLSKKEQKPEPPKVDNVPKINEKSQKIKRDKKIDNILFEDAQRRKSLVEKQQDLEIQLPKLKKSNLIILQGKLEKEIKQNFLKLVSKENEVTENQIEEHKLDIGDLEKLLTTLQFVVDTKSEEKQKNQKLLQQFVWLELGDQNQGIYFSHLKQFLFVVMGYYNPKDVEAQPEGAQVQKLVKEFQETQLSFKPYGTFNERIYEIPKSQYLRLNKDFKLFYTNFNENKKSNKNPTFKAAPEEPPFRPSLCKGTTQIRKEMKEKVSEKEAKEYANKQKETKLNQLSKREQLKMEVEEKEISVCSFRPSTTNNKIYQQKRPSDCNEVLYGQAKEFSEKRAELMKKKEELPDQDQLTFKPDTQKSSQSKKLLEKANSQSVKGVENAIERMQQARKNKEVIEQLKSKGFPFQGDKEIQVISTNFFDVGSNRSKAQRAPEKLFDQLEEEGSNAEKSLLYIDISLGRDRNERIIVYEGDKADDVALQFIKTHNLDKSILPKLKQIIGEQISKMQSQEQEGKNEFTIDQEQEEKNQQEKQKQEQASVSNSQTTEQSQKQEQEKASEEKPPQEVKNE